MRLLWSLAAAFFWLVSCGGAEATTPLPDVPIPQSLGVSMHFLDLQLPSHMDYLEKSHIGWVRRDIFWSDIEAEKGKYDFTLYDHLVDTLHASGVRIMFILDYGNPLYTGDHSPNDEGAQDAFARFAAAAAKRYSGRVDAWEIYNEPNNKEFWKPKVDAEQYVRLANKTTSAILEADPDAVIVGPGLMGPWISDAEFSKGSVNLAYLNQVLASSAAHHWSAISVHPYRSPGKEPETVFSQLETARRLMKANGIDPGKVPLIISEWGYSTFDQGVDEETQAAYAVRSYLIAGIEHMPVSMWYDWQDDGTDIHNNEHRFGMLRHGTLWNGDFTSHVVKPSYSAVEQFADLLDGYRVDKVLASDSNVLLVRLRDSSDVGFAVWSSDDQDRDTKVPLPDGTWNVTPISGPSRQVIMTGNDSVPLRVGKMPIIILTAPSN